MTAGLVPIEYNGESIGWYLQLGVRADFWGRAPNVQISCWCLFSNQCQSFKKIGPGNPILWATSSIISNGKKAFKRNIAPFKYDGCLDLLWVQLHFFLPFSSLGASWKVPLLLVGFTWQPCSTHANRGKSAHSPDTKKLLIFCPWFWILSKYYIPLRACIS